jgi:flagellar hook-basal body complex protein FliE
MIDAISSLNATSLASEMKKALDTDSTSATASAATSMTAAAPGASFTDYMQDIGNTFVNNLKGAEKASTDGILGKASVREVVESVMTADQTLQTAMAFRDKIVSAYLDVVKMPI